MPKPHSALYYCSQINFEARTQNLPHNNDCLLSVDGTDFRNQNLTGAILYKYSKKVALWYEVGLDILRGRISWIHGPFPAGRWPNINIFCDGLVHHLGQNERVKANDGYSGEAPGKVKCLASVVNPIENEGMQSRVRNRHETVNKWFKLWGVLNQIYRHNIDAHAYIFRAIVVLTQLSLENDEPLFPVSYKDPT